MTKKKSHSTLLLIPGKKERAVIGVTSPKTPLPLKMQHFKEPFTKIKKLAFPVACRPTLLKKNANTRKVSQHGSRHLLDPP